MSVFDSFPLMNAYSVNLDWIIKKIRELEEYVRNYTAVNNVSYAGVWDITKQYTQWAVVSNGDSTYMSKKPVPTGIDIENAEFWIHLADLDPRIGGIINEISGIENNISNIENDISNIENLTLNRRFILIGDSYGVFPEGNSWADIISKKFNVAKSVSTGGAGFVGKNPGYTFIKELESCADVAKPKTVTDIVVVGGYNDMHYVLDGGGLDKLGEAIRVFAERAGQLFPNAKLHIGFAGWDNGGIYWKQNTPIAFSQVIPYYQEACRFNSNWAYIGGLEFVMHAPGLVSDDKYHPNGEGAVILASTIASHLMGGSNSGTLLPTTPHSVTITPSGNVSNINLTASNSKVVGCVGRLYLDYIYVTFNKDVNVGGFVSIGTIENCPFQPVIGKSSVNYTVYADEGSQQCALFIEGRTLSFAPLSKNYKSGTAIAIKWTSWTEPLL